jgi:release factor glutamine methyltransferase
MTRPPTLRGALRDGIAALARHRCVGADAVRDAETLLLAATGLRREDLVADPGRAVSAATARRFRALLRRRAAHEPMAYLTGEAWFLGRAYAVTPATLVPRPATEHVVLAAVAAAPDAGLAVDVGTGSGAIAVSLAAALPRARALATDRSAAAIRVARGNARRNGATVRFHRGDLVAPARAALARAARPLVVANLPYVPTRAMAKLAPDVRAFEPRAALDGGPDGLALYRRMVSQLRRARPKGGFVLAAEIFPGQYAPLRRALRAAWPRATTERVRNDGGVTVGLLARV